MSHYCPTETRFYEGTDQDFSKKWGGGQRSFLLDQINSIKFLLFKAFFKGILSCLSFFEALFKGFSILRAFSKAFDCQSSSLKNCSQVSLRSQKGVAVYTIGSDAVAVAGAVADDAVAICEARAKEQQERQIRY